MNVDWGFIFRITVIVICFLVTLAEFLQGGAPWPFVVFVVFIVAALVVAGALTFYGR